MDSLQLFKSLQQCIDPNSLYSDIIRIDAMLIGISNPNLIDDFRKFDVRANLGFTIEIPETVCINNVILPFNGQILIKQNSFNQAVLNLTKPGRYYYANPCHTIYVAYSWTPGTVPDVFPIVIWQNVDLSENTVSIANLPVNWWLPLAIYLCDCFNHSDLSVILGDILVLLGDINNNIKNIKLDCCCESEKCDCSDEIEEEEILKKKLEEKNKINCCCENEEIEEEEDMLKYTNCDIGPGASFDLKALCIFDGNRHTLSLASAIPSYAANMLVELSFLTNNTTSDVFFLYPTGTVNVGLIALTDDVRTGGPWEQCGIFIRVNENREIDYESSGPYTGDAVVLTVRGYWEKIS